MNEKRTSCIDKVEKVFESRMEEIRILWNAEDNETEELGSLNDYGLSIDFVEPGTFTGQKRGYYRYQLSWGGPSDEFRIYNDDHVEFWYLDWFDGASVRVTGEDASIIRWIIEPHME